MNEKVLAFASLIMLSISTYAQNMQIQKGWQLKGTETGFSSMQAFNKDCIDTVWSYDISTNSWKAYSPKSKISAIINNNPDIQNLTNLMIDEGFWIKANSNCLIQKEGNISTPIVIYQTNSLWPYATKFTLDMIANKSFKILQYSNNGNTLTFDENGFYSSEDNDYNISLRGDGILVSKYMAKTCNPDMNITTEKLYEVEEKILASDPDIGYIIVSRSYDDYNHKYFEHISSMILDTATENPIDMSTKLPYTTFSSWGLENGNGQTYELNGTITYFDKNGIHNCYDDNNFTIENGAIVTRYDYNDTNSESHYVNIMQIVYSMGDYDILKYTQEGFDKNYQISYSDENNTWKTIDLNSSVITWNDIFKLTNNKLYDNTYDLENGTITNNHYLSCNTHIQTFTLLDNNKTLKTCWDGDKYCDKQTIENGAIVREYNDTEGHYEVVKTKPYF